MWTLWDQHIAGTPEGSFDTEGACQIGGSVHITGSTSVETADDGTVITKPDLALGLNGCKQSSAWGSLTYNGSDGAMSFRGSWGTSGGTPSYSSVTWAGSASVVGEVVPYQGQTAPVDEATPSSISITQTSTAEDYQYSGEFCDKPFSL